MATGFMPLFFLTFAVTSNAHNFLNSNEEWVPSYLQDLLEKRLHHKGLDLNSLVQLALALEELVNHESKNRLTTAYEIHDFPTDGGLTRDEADDLVRTWYVSFLLAGNFSASSPEEDWQDAENWLGELEKEHYEGEPAQTFDSNFRLVQKIGERYFHFNDGECRALKATMQDMEGKKAGRVRLSTFYKKSLYSHWRFTEKADYLRKLGALDDSDPQQPQVIMANYMMARPNCLEASGLYAICCRNECEDLMGQLESELKTSMAEPSRILQFVSNLASDTVAAPRELSQALQTRLKEVANLHGGKVPIHGRLFAQWMHHAFPRECPYPHEFGTTSPQTPDEWMKETGESDSSATLEEMQKQVASDVCQLDENGNPKAGCNEDEDLPWSGAEDPVFLGPELLVKSTPSVSSTPVKTAKLETKLPDTPTPVPSPTVTQKEVAQAKPGARGVICAVLLSITLATALIWDYIRAAANSRQSKGEVLYINQISSRDLENKLAGCKKAMAVWALASVAWMMDLLDTTIFSCSMCCGILILTARNLPFGFGPKRGMHKAALCLVSGQVFARQVKGLNTMDKVLFLWALAKCKVMHLALCRLLVRDLAVENCGKLPRDKVGLALWSLAVVWPSLSDVQAWRQLLASTLLAAQPWLMAPAYEVTNAAWAFSQLPETLVSRSWPSLLQTMTWLQPGQLSEHELCNLLVGLSSCTLEAPLLTETFTTFSGELVARLDRCFSVHDQRLLASAIVSTPTLWRTLEAPMLEKIKDGGQRLAELTQLEHALLRMIWKPPLFLERPSPRPSCRLISTQRGQPQQCTRQRSSTIRMKLIRPRKHRHLPRTLRLRYPKTKRLILIVEVRKRCPKVAGMIVQATDTDVQATGHCVQLKHTFIHVDCPTSDSEDCMLCNITRRRARSADSKEPHAVASASLETEEAAGNLEN
eukprot:g7000.t1